MSSAENNPSESWIITHAAGGETWGAGPPGDAAAQALGDGDTIEIVDQLPELPPTAAISEIDADRASRDKLINNALWTVAPGSPLTDACLADWAAWIAEMHRVVMDGVDREDWPAEPVLEFRS